MTVLNKDRLFADLAAAERNRYFFGKRLNVHQFQKEQDYHRRQQALINRLSLGKGVLCGLSIRVEGDRLFLGPGVAMDGLGREITVPHTAEIDPWGAPTNCPCCDDSEPRQRDVTHIVTVNVCYRECLSDHQPSFVDDCAAPDACEAGSVVESYCISLTDGQPDRRLPSPGCEALHEHDASLERDDRIALKRTRLCELLDATCEADPDAACVPVATVELLADGTIGSLTVCPVRPRLYSNETLLELILCLADRIEECCENGGGDPDPDPDPVETFRVAGVRWIASGTDGQAFPLPADIPLRAEVPFNREIQEVEIEFTADVDPGPVSPSNGNSPIATYNIRIERLDNGSVIRGVALLTSPRTIRFRARNVFRRGEYRLTVIGDSDPSGQPVPLTDTLANRLDGEPLGLPSGDKSEGGNFVAEFTVA